MNIRFRRASALLATVAMVSGGLIAALAAPASASTPTGCEAALCYTGLPVDGGLATGTSPPDYAGGPYSLGLSFTVAHKGVVWAVCYPNKTSPATDQTDNVFLSNGTTTIGPVAAIPLSGGQSCGFFDAAIPAGTWMAYYSEQSNYYQTTGGGTGSVGGGELTMNGGYYSGSGFPNVGAGGYNFGINLYFQSDPNPPDITLAATSLTTLTATFAGDGVAPVSVTCSSSATGLLGTFTTSPILLTVPNLASQTVTCTATESVTAHYTRTASSSAQVTMTGASGPGCVGTVTAPATPTSASEAFPGAVVSWGAVAADPPQCLVGYLVTPSGGAPPKLVLGHGTTTVVRGLTLGSTYTFTVAAVTGSGVGPASDPTSPVTIGTPAAATAVKATHAAKGAITVAFKAGRNNGAAITGFVATCGSKSALGKSSPITVKGLTAGKSYTCTVRAANSRGIGAAGRSGAAKA